MSVITSWNPDKKHTDPGRWVCIYPTYINNKKSVREGRRVPRKKCVDNPTYQEIRDVLSAAGFATTTENTKVHPRELIKDPQNRGRVRVQFRNEDGSLANPAFPSRESLMIHAGEMIPKLKTRQHRHGEQHSQQSAAGKKGGKGKKGKR